MIAVKHTLLKNTFWLSVSEAGSRLLKFGLILYAARILGAEEWGAFAYSVGMVSLFLIISDFGLNNVVTREIAQGSEKKLNYLSTTFYIRLILIIVAVMSLMVVVPRVSSVTRTSLLLVVALVAGLDSLRDLFISWHRAMGRVEQEALIKITSGIMVVILGIGVLLVAPTVLNLGYAYLAGSTAGLLLALFTLRRELDNFSGKFSGELIGSVLQISWPLFIFGVIGVIMGYADIALLGIWHSAGEVGFYAAAQRLLQFLLVIPNLIVVAIFPIFSKLSIEEPDKLRPILEKTLAIMFLLALPLFLFGAVFSQEIIAAIFGPEYAPTAPVFQLLSAIILINFPMLIINNYIFVLNQHRKYIPYMIGGAVLNVLLNLIFIPAWGSLGAALATTLATFVLGISMWLRARRISYFEVWPSIQKIFRAGFSPK